MQVSLDDLDVVKVGVTMVTDTMSAIALVQSSMLTPFLLILDSKVNRCRAFHRSLLLPDHQLRVGDAHSPGVRRMLISTQKSSSIASHALVSTPRLIDWGGV